MKTLLRLIGLFLLAFLFLMCSDDEKLSPEKVQFTFTFSPLNSDGGRVKATSLPDGMSVLISIETTAGVPVLTNHTISLLTFGESYITTPLELIPGGYKVVDFMLVNSASEVLYATPRAGSLLGSIVSHTLPYKFSVAKNNVTTIAMDVVDVSQNDPEDFGYASFSVHVINPFRLSVFVPTVKGTKLTTATAFLLSGGDTLRTYPVKSRVNLLAFAEDVDEELTLVVIKDGFARYSRNFSYTNLMSELNGHPLEIILEPAFTFVANGGWFEISITGSEGHSISIDWGDGTADPYTFSNSEEGIRIHEYSNVGEYFVSVTGDINFIESFYSFYGTGVVHKINPEHLTILNSFRLGLSPNGPRLIDLSHNPKLADVNIQGLAELENIILPTSNEVIYILVEGLPSLTVASIDDIINKVYNASVIHNRRRGIFGLNADWTGIGNNLVGPPSPASISKLIELRDYYDWRIYPDL